MRYFPFLLLLLAACTGKPHPADHRAPAPPAPPPAPSETCYRQVLQRDTFTASLIQEGAVISGRLTFDNFEKDGSSGTVTGRQDGDILKLWYSFQSEGQHSVLEVWYRRQDGALLRGVGPVATKEDTAYFADPQAVRFDPGQRLTPVPCSGLSTAFPD